MSIGEGYGCGDVRLGIAVKTVTNLAVEEAAF